MSRILSIEGRALPLRGDDIDTDRIVPARFLVAITFEGLGEHAFADDRGALEGRHAFDRPGHAGATILVVNRNFGCGSSREHAPQALQRRGIQALVGESFSAIFAGNAQALGMPCATAPRDVVAEMQELAETRPETVFELDVVACRLRAGERSWEVAIVTGAREALLSGDWDPMARLLADFDEVRAVASRLPYTSAFDKGESGSWSS